VKEAMFMRGVENALLQLVLQYRRRKRMSQTTAISKHHDSLDLTEQFTQPEMLPTRTSPLYQEPPTQLAFLWHVLTGLGNRAMRVGRASYRLVMEGEAAREARRKRAREIDAVLRADPAKVESLTMRRAAWIYVISLLGSGREGVVRRIRGRKDGHSDVTVTLPTRSFQTNALQLDKTP